MKEYIDGDLVRYTSLYKEPIAEICEVRETSYLIRFMNGNFAKVTSQEIKPIPLTTDILEKNGWKFIGHQMDFGGFLLDIYSKRDILPYLYYYYATKDFSVSIFGEVALPDIKYIHQLQHFLFGLGLNSEMEV
jgi:hypothetical protein